MGIMDREHAIYVKTVRERLSPYTDPGPSLAALEARLKESFFTHVAPYVNHILQVFELLKTCDLEQIPLNRLKQVLGNIDNANNHLNDIRNYGPNAPPPHDLSTRVLSVLDRLYSEVLLDVVKANALGERSKLEAAEKGLSRRQLKFREVKKATLTDPNARSGDDTDCT